jgi:peptidoglycan hydrolase-like protein with peptidoglycan-binding domain
VGAYAYGKYREGMDGREDSRLGAAILAIKAELKYTGYARPAMDVKLPYFGDAVANSVGDFQKAKGLTVDEECGQVTLRELFRKRIEWAERAYWLPAKSLGKKIALESAFDPVAIGYADPADMGIAQINTKIHGVSEEDAFTPAYAIPWAAGYLFDQKKAVEDRADTWRAARAAYNVGNFYATEWMLAGFPASGRVENGIDWYDRATKYIALVDAKEF